MWFPLLGLPERARDRAPPTHTQIRTTHTKRSQADAGNCDNEEERRKEALVSDRVDTTESCEACRTIDEADGVVDGRLYLSLARPPTGRPTLVGARKVELRASDAISAFAGSPTFVYLHIVWFGFWILAALGVFGRGLVFDPFPFGLLTMIVSLEAIFLSTFILITQNRQGERSEARAQFDFHNNVRGEIWAAHIGQALGLDAHHVEHMVKRTVEGYLKDVEDAADHG
jgi:uncharacterized membrane protein